MPRAHRVAYFSGLAGVTAVVALTVVGGAAFPGYSHVRQYISELGAHGAPHGAWVTYAGFLPAGVLLTLFAAAAARALPRSGWTALALGGVGLFALGYLNSVPFRCDPGCRPTQPSLSQVLHNAGGLLGYLSGTAALLLLGVQARRWPRAGLLRGLALGGGIVSLLALGGLDPASPSAGLAQRLIEGSMLTWILAAALYLRPGLPARATLPEGAGPALRASPR